jgi:hypothetical protein
MSICSNSAEWIERGRNEKNHLIVEFFSRRSLQQFCCKFAATRDSNQKLLIAAYTLTKTGKTMEVK